MFREEEIYNDNEDGFREEEDEETNDDGLFISEELNNEQSTLEIQSTGVPLSIAQELAFMPDEDEEEGLSLGLRTEDAQTLRTLVTCPKCRELMENPYSLSCLHRFCFRCLPTEKCFVCMRAIGPTEKPFPDQAYETIVASLFPHHCFYCGQTDGASVETHRKHCTALEECPHRGCQERLYPHEKVAHVETCCHRPATCFGCKRPFSVGKLKHHEQVCPELVSCCGELVRSEDLARRHARKLGIVVRDQNRQHAEFVPCKRFKLAHKCDTCGSIHGVHESCVVACPYCKEMFSADYMPTHKLLCLEASITCQSCEDQFPGSPLAKMNRKSGQAHHDVFHKLGTPFVVPVNVCAISPLLECLLLGKMPTHLPCPSYAYNKSHCVYKRHACSTYVSNAGLTPLLEASPYILARDCSKIAFALFKTEETARSFRIDVFECSTMNSILPQDACNSESFDLYDFERRPDGKYKIRGCFRNHHVILNASTGEDLLRTINRELTVVSQRTLTKEYWQWNSNEYSGQFLDIAISSSTDWEKVVKVVYPNDGLDSNFPSVLTVYVAGTNVKFPTLKPCRMQGSVIIPDWMARIDSLVKCFQL